MEVGPYLISYRKIPAIEFFVKLKLFWLATHVVYRHDGTKDINLDGKNLREVLQIDPSDLPLLQKPGADIRDLRLLRILRMAGHQPSEEFFTWVNANELTEYHAAQADALPRPTLFQIKKEHLSGLCRSFVRLQRLPGIL